MNQNLIDKLRQKTSSKNAIAFLPFFDNRVTLADQGLADALPWFFYDIFAEKNNNLIHPLITTAWWQSKQKSDNNLASDQNAKDAAKELGARFVVYGLFQRIAPDGIRFVVRLYDAKSDSFLSPPINFETAYNDTLLQKLELQLANLSKSQDMPHLLVAKDIKYPTLASLLLYGHAARMGSFYSRLSLEQSVSVYEQALQSSFENYDAAAVGLALVHAKLALLARSDKMSAALPTRQSEQAENLIRAPKQVILRRQELTDIKMGIKLSDQALTELGLGHLNEALKLSDKALGYIPEDPLTQAIYLKSGGSSSRHNEVKSWSPLCL